MAVRLTWGLILGTVFLSFTMQSLPWAVFALFVMHIAAQLEFAKLDENLSPLQCWLHAAITTLAWLVVTLALSGCIRAEYVAIMIALLMLCYSVIAVMRYERGWPYRQYIVLLRSVVFITLPMAFIPALAAWPDALPVYLLLIGASWGADTGAIFTGKYLGHTPLSPRLSPKKTTEGAIGGMVSAGTIWAGVVLLYPTGMLAPLIDAFGIWLAVAAMFVSGAALSVVGMYGDLVFSLYKREEQVKDYSATLPGHGGILDRFDSILFVAPVLYLFCMLMA